MSRKKCVVFALSAMTALLQSACQDVSTGLYEPELYSPKAESFKLDVAMLSEWEGAYAPVEYTLNFCHKPDSYFRQSTQNYINCNSNSCDLSEDQNLLVINISNFSSKDELNKLENIYNVNCYLVTDSIRSKYNISDNCIHDKSNIQSGETQYYCTLNLNIPDSTKIDTAWSSVFPQLYSTSVGSIQIENIPLCIYTESQDSTDPTKPETTVHIRSNTKVASLSQQSLDQISKVDSTNENIYIKLLKSSDESDNEDYYEVKCNKKNSDTEICVFEGEDAYTCTTYLNGATGLNRTWHGIFEQTDVPLVIVGNGDSFGSSQPNSREFDDYPTIQLLSSLGFSADMFGNHVFDKDLRLINKMLAEASYPHVISNLSDVSQNLPNLAPYSILLVPEEGSECSEKDTKSCCRSSENPDGADCLGVAVVAALDKSVMSYVQPGKFGSLQTRDYCDVLYALQKAYNANARAFFVLAHVFAASDYATTEAWRDNGAQVAYTTNPPTLTDIENKRVSIFPLLQILFSLNEESTLCDENHLILPTDRIKQKHELCPAICKESESACEEICASACKDGQCDDARIQASVTRELNREIFNSIIAVFSAAGDQHMVGFTSSEIPENTPGLVHFEMDRNSELPVEPYFFNTNSVDTKNLFNASSAEFSSLLANDNMGALFKTTPLEIKQAYFEQTNKRYNHPIWVIRLPEGGNATAKLEVTLNRADTHNDRGNLAQPYVANVNYAKLVQTFHSPEEVEKPAPLNCLANIKSIISSDDNYKGLTVDSIANKCNSISDSDDLAPACSCYNYFFDAQNYLINEDNSKEPSYEMCQKYLAERSVPNTSRSLKPDVLQNIWDCLYHSKDYAMCSSENDSSPWNYSEEKTSQETGLFKEITLFDLSKTPNIQSSTLIDDVETLTEEELRSQTTFVGSWVSDVLLSAFNNSDVAHYDALLLNAGAFNRIEDVQKTAYTKSALRNIITYSNTFKATSLTPSAFVNYITNAISTFNEGRGQYPVFAGLMLSTINMNSSTQVAEVWSTHQPRDFRSSNCQEDNCQCTDGACLERTPQNYLKEPLYQLIDLIYVDKATAGNNSVDDNTESTSIDCTAEFKKLLNKESEEADSFYNHLSNFIQNKGNMYVFYSDFKWDDESRFSDYITKPENADKIKLKREICTSDYNDKLVNVYYPKLNASSDNTSPFFPMRVHIAQENISSSGTDTAVCKCYLTALEEGKGYTPDGPRQFAIVDDENELRDKVLDIAVIYYIATGGDGYKLPSLVNPAYNSNDNNSNEQTYNYGQASFKYIAPEAYFDGEAFQATDSIIPNYFPSHQDSKLICSGLSANPKLYDGRSDLEFVWDNSFYRHIDTTQVPSLIMEHLGSMGSFRPEYGSTISISSTTSEASLD